jgi:hypothetical protein
MAVVLALAFRESQVPVAPLWAPTLLLYRAVFTCHTYACTVPVRVTNAALVIYATLWYTLSSHPG